MVSRTLRPSPATAAVIERMLTPKPLLVINREVLKRLGIKLAPSAGACLARPANAPAFKLALSSVNLQRCRSAEAVIELLDQALIGAMIGRGDTLLQRVFLTPSETLANHYELHLTIKPQRG